MLVGRAFSAVRILIAWVLRSPMAQRAEALGLARLARRVLSGALSITVLLAGLGPYAAAAREASAPADVSAPSVAPAVSARFDDAGGPDGAADPARAPSAKREKFTSSSQQQTSDPRRSTIDAGLVPGSPKFEAAQRAALAAARDTAPSADVSSASAASVESMALSAAITFDEYPVGTPISTQYATAGVLFAGPNGPRIATDGANPTSPVLSGGPAYQGDIHGLFTLPGTTQTAAVDSVSLDLGYVDTANTTRVDFYGAFGKLLGYQTVPSTGIVRINWTYPGTTRFLVHRITNDPAGWAIDNVSFSTAYPSPDSWDWTQGLGGGNPGQNPQDCSSGDPVSCATGNLWEQATDFAIPGRGRPLVLQRTYNALDAVTAGAPGRFGYGWSDSYASHLLFGGYEVDGFVTVVQGNGSRLEFWPDPDGGYQTTSWTTAALVRNTDGSYTVTYRDQSADLYDSTGRLVAQTDRNDHTTTLTYGPGTDGNLTTVTDPAGRTLTFTYNPDGTVDTSADPMGHTIDYGYDTTTKDLISVTDPTGATTRFSYSASHELVTITDANNGVTRNTYDTQHRVITQVDPANRTLTFDYSGPADYGAGAAGVTVITDNLGHKRRLTFDGTGNLTTHTLGHDTPLAQTWTYTHDPQTGHVLTATDPNNHTRTFTWDNRGNLLTLTDPLGHTSHRTYTGDNDVATATDPLGNLTSYDYDTRGNLTAVTSQLDTTGEAATLTFEYTDPAHPGDVTKVTDPSGRHHTIGYDNAGNATTITDGLGNTVRSTYNAAGWLTSVTSPRGATTGADAAAFTTSYTHNARGQTTRIDAPAGQSTQYRYDPVGNLTSVIDGKSNTTRYDYNPVNQLTTITRRDTTTLVTTYNGVGQAVGQTDGLGQTTTYEYDALGRHVSSTDPLNRTTRYSYDPAGNPKTLTDALNRVTTYGYDNADRLTTITYSDATTPDVTFGYDNAGRRTTMTDGTGTTTWAYDSLHRITAESPARPRRGLQYTYDLAGHVTALSYPDGDTVTKTYDAAGRMDSVTDPLGNTTRFDYNADNALTAIHYPNGVTSHRTYNDANQVTLIRDTTPPSGTLNTGMVLLNLPYTRDNNGLIATQNRHPVPTPTPTGIDPADTLVVPEGIDRDLLDQVTGTHLTQPTNPAVETYRYDAGDNLTHRALADGVTDTFTYDTAHQLTAITNPTQTTTYTHNAVGERTSSTTTTGPLGTTILNRTYNYDQAGRFTSYSGPPLQALNNNAGISIRLNYEYDGLGRRSDFTWNTAEGGLPLIADDGAHRYITGPGGLVVEQLTLGNTPHYLHSDQLGSTRLITDSEARPLLTFSYDAFGRTTTTALADLTGLGLTSPITPIQYAGSYTDLDSGLIYLRARWYDPTTAKFLTRDPLEDLTGQPYSYANNNPIDLTDPTGQCPICLGLVVGFAVGATLDLATQTSELTPGCNPLTNINWNQVATAGALGATPTGAGTWLYRTLKLRTLNLLPGLPASAPKPLGLGSTGRTVPGNLTEQLAMTEVRSAPSGRVLSKVPMTDPRWPASDGWIKMQQIVNGVNIHYVRNTVTGAVDDFKFVMRR